MWTSWPFIAVSVLFLVLSITFIFSDYLVEITSRRLFKRRFRVHLFRYAKNHDWLLVNKVHLALTEEKKQARIDAVLFGDKYVYQIALRDYPGAVTGDGHDAQWIVMRGKRSLLITNPLLANETRKHVLSTALQVDPSNIINVVVVARNSVLDDIRTASPYQLVVSEKDFDRAIQYIEDSAQVPSYLDTTVETYAQRLVQISDSYK